MSIFNSFGKSLVALLLSAISFQASALTYSVTENFTGTWEAIWGLPIATFTHASSSQTFLSGNAIFSNSSIQSESIIDTLVNCVSCTITETLSGGDKIFFEHLLTDGALTPSTSTLGSVDNFYNGTVTITGGTGLFAGASGNGTFTAIDFGIYNTDSNGNFVSFNRNGNWQIELIYSVTTAVPEPQSTALLLAGLGLINITMRRNSKA